MSQELSMSNEDLKKFIQDVCDQEVEWCFKHPATNLSKPWQEGFRAGVTQAKNILLGLIEEVEAESEKSTI